MSHESIERTVLERRSVRAFTAKRVPQPLLRRIFEVAQSAPSNCNVQPWRVYVASGAARDRIRDGLVQAASTGRPQQPDFERGAEFCGVYRKHQIECAVALYSQLGVARDDEVGRGRAWLRNFQLFDAPHVAFVGMDREFRTSVALDVGIYVQTLMLMMTAHGIASCSMGSLRSYPDVVRAELGIPDEIGVLCGLCFGYEETSHPANRTRTTRAPLEENVTFREV